MHTIQLSDEEAKVVLNALKWASKHTTNEAAKETASSICNQIVEQKLTACIGFIVLSENGDCVEEENKPILFELEDSSDAIELAKAMSQEGGLTYKPLTVDYEYFRSQCVLWCEKAQITC